MEREAWHALETILSGVDFPILVMVPHGDPIFLHAQARVASTFPAQKVNGRRLIAHDQPRL